ncbi:MAG: T9SS type A sorting domain-containing protein [Flavobacteriales bacterium]|nr:T9SS type A sorting domain-containing protein [Flavobacteriales bacterium]
MRNLLLLPLLLSVATAVAQDPCDDLDILSVRYSPFTDTVIIVEVANNGEEIFSYPGFVLINSDGDTLALETVNYFGIGQQSVHHLTVRPGIAAPTDVFQGVLELYSDFFNMQECSWAMDSVLCVTEECEGLVIGFENWGGALVLGDFTFALTDSTGSEVAAGAFTMTAEEQYWQQTICLRPGSYTYSVTALGEPSGGGPTMTVASGPWFGSAGMSQPFPWYDALSFDMEVPFYLHCMDSGTVSTPTLGAARAPVTVAYDPTLTLLSHPQGITSVTLIGMDGRHMGTWHPGHTVFALPDGLPAGLYVAQVTTREGKQLVKVAIR